MSGKRRQLAADLAAARRLSERYYELVAAVRAHPYGRAAWLVGRARRLVARPLAALNEHAVILENQLYRAARQRLAARFPDLAGAPWW